jgi:hypothetical protein
MGKSTVKELLCGLRLGLAISILFASVYIIGIPGCFRTVDSTIGRDFTCEIHHIRMARTKVPVEFGLIAEGGGRPGYYDAAARLFPHARSYYLGGCVMSPELPRRAFIYVCPECRIAKENWYAQHPLKTKTN